MGVDKKGNKKENTARIIIEMSGGILKLQPTDNAIQTLGMLSLATAEVIARLQHTPDKDPRIIIPKLHIPKA